MRFDQSARWISNANDILWAQNKCTCHLLLRQILRGPVDYPSDYFPIHQLVTGQLDWELIVRVDSLSEVFEELSVFVQIVVFVRHRGRICRKEIARDEFITG